MGEKARCIRSLRKVVTWYAAERIELITWVTRLEDERGAAEKRIADLLEHYEDRCAYESDALAKQEVANERIAALEKQLAAEGIAVAAYQQAIENWDRELTRLRERCHTLEGLLRRWVAPWCGVHPATQAMDMALLDASRAALAPAAAAEAQAEVPHAGWEGTQQ